jgi:hypothetical protein
MAAYGVLPDSGASASPPLRYQALPRRLFGRCLALCDRARERAPLSDAAAGSERRRRRRAGGLCRQGRHPGRDRGRAARRRFWATLVAAVVIVCLVSESTALQSFAATACPNGAGNANRHSGGSGAPCGRRGLERHAARRPRLGRGASDDRGGRRHAGEFPRRRPARGNAQLDEVLRTVAVNVSWRSRCL